jgi:hypothetical protein
MALKTLSSAALAVASGPGDVEITFIDHDGAYVRHTALDGSGLVNWTPWAKGVPAILRLAAGQWLHLRGRQTAFVGVIDATEI